MIVGVNQFSQPETASIDVLKIDESAARLQLEKLVELRRTRDASRVNAALDNIRLTAEGTGNLMPALLEAVRAYATTGEICSALGTVFTYYRESPAI